MSAIRTITINGHAIRDIASFYAEINRVFMGGEDWTLGHSLDAFDDLLYGGYGAIAGREPVTLVWQGFDGSRAALGYEATRAFLQEKLRQPTVYDVALIGRQIEALESGTGQTYAEIIAAIIADHDNITLVKA